MRNAWNYVAVQRTSFAIGLGPSDALGLGRVSGCHGPPVYLPSRRDRPGDPQASPSRSREGGAVLLFVHITQGKVKTPLGRLDHGLRGTCQPARG